MFSKEVDGDSIETVIGPSVQVDGNFVANGDIVIEGTVSGNIRTEKNLRIGEKARIFANITAANAVIAGEVQGNVKVKESLELTSTAKIFGDVKTKILNVSPGASLQGKCISGEEKKSRLEKADDLRKTGKTKPEVKEISIAEKVK